MSFGENLRSQRIRSGMTQEELGRALEKSKNNISQYETGKREPDLKTLVRLAELFGVTVDELLKKGVACGVIWQDGRPFNHPDSIRMNLALPTSLVKEAFERLAQYVFCA